MKNVILFFCLLLFTGTILAISSDCDVGAQTELVKQLDSVMVESINIDAVTTNHKLILIANFKLHPKLEVIVFKNLNKKNLSIPVKVQNGTSGGCADKQN